MYAIRSYYEGKLFRPLAFTKTFALLGAFILGIVVLPTLAHFVFGINYDKKRVRRTWGIILIIGGLLLAITMHMWLPLFLCVLGLNSLFEHKLPVKFNKYTNYINIGITILVVITSYSIHYTKLYDCSLAPEATVFSNGYKSTITASI